MRKLLTDGPSRLALFALVCLSAIFVGTAMRAQTNASTLYGCTSITSCTGSANIPVLVDSAGRVQSTITGTASPTVIKCADGTINAPCYSWTNATTSGWYRAGSGDFRFSLAGVDKQTITSGTTAFGNNTAVPAGGSMGIGSSMFFTGVSPGVFKTQNDAVNAGVTVDVTSDGTYKITNRAGTANTGQIEVGATFRSDGFVFNQLAANLGSNGQFGYCSDCNIVSPCTGGGTGAIAKRLNNVFVCN